MNPNNAIEVKSVNKKFKVYSDKGHSLKDKVLQRSRNKYEIRTVLEDVSFDIKKGEAVGLIGYNGCGKSTTLKLLTKIIQPDTGTIELVGRVSSLLELGAGFHPDLSGRENIYINASIFGLGKREINQRIDDIIAFAELEEYIDNPVRTYSSGMYMRLAFSVAINVDADILLIDEILAVGDVNFQNKCFNKLMELKAKGVTLVLVSHSTDQIERMCERSIWIHEGKVFGDGDAVTINRKYANFMRNQREEMMIAEADNEAAKGEKTETVSKEFGEQSNTISMEYACLKDSIGNRKAIYTSGDDILFEVELFTEKELYLYILEVNLVRNDGVFYSGCSTANDCINPQKWQGKRQMSILFSGVDLASGNYHFDVHVADKEGKTLAFFGNVAEFEMESMKPMHGLIGLKHTWRGIE